MAKLWQGLHGHLKCAFSEILQVFRPGWFTFAASMFIWVATISPIPDRQAKKSNIPCTNVWESFFPGKSQFLNPANKFFIFPNLAQYFGQIPDPKNTLPDPRMIRSINVWKLTSQVSLVPSWPDPVANIETTKYKLFLTHIIIIIITTLSVILKSVLCK